MLTQQKTDIKTTNLCNNCFCLHWIWRQSKNSAFCFHGLTKTAEVALFPFKFKPNIFKRYEIISLVHIEHHILSFCVLKRDSPPFWTASMQVWRIIVQEEAADKTQNLLHAHPQKTKIPLEYRAWTLCQRFEKEANYTPKYSWEIWKQNLGEERTCVRL